MSARVNVQFPNIYDTKEVDFPVRDGNISFIDVIQCIKRQLPESSPPLQQLYLTVDNVLWKPKVYSTSQENILTTKTNDYTETYTLYDPPQFNTPFWGPSGGTLTALNMKVNDLIKAKLVLDYYAVISIVHGCDCESPVYKIVVPSKVVKRMRSCQRDDVNYTYMWDLTLELDPHQYSAHRLAETASWLFIECIVYDAQNNVVRIKEEYVNFDTLWPCCHTLANLLQLEQLPCEDFNCMSVLQHPVTEYHRYRKWGELAVKRLHKLLTCIHTLPASSMNKKSLMCFLLSFLRCCSRTESAVVRPPSWPYRNPSLIEEDLFLTDAFVSRKQIDIGHFIDSYPVVKDVTFLNKELAPYTICCESVATSRLMQYFPMAQALCSKGVLLAGSLCSRLCVDEWLAVPQSGCIQADLFIYGSTASKRYKYLEGLVKCIETHRDYCIKYCVCKNMVKVSMWKLSCPKGSVQPQDYTNRVADIELQIIYTNATTKAEVLYNFDSSYLQCGFNQGKFMYTPEYCYFTPRRESLIMRASIQLHRLLKIINRGFLPVLTQPRCCILGTREDLPKLYCNRDCTFTFTYGKFICACNKGGLDQIKITQNFGSTKVGGNNYCVSNVHYINLPKRKEKCVHVFHLLKSIRYNDLLLNTYNSYAGCKIVRLNAKKATIYKSLVLPCAETKLLDIPNCGCLHVSEFNVTGCLTKDDKILRKQIKADIKKAAQAKIQLYENSLANGRLIQILNVDEMMEEYYTYRPPLNDIENKNAVYVVNLNGVDTFPTFEEINAIIAREQQKLTPKIGLAHFDINVRVGEKCKNGIKLDGTEIIHLPHSNRFLFTNIQSVEDVVLQYVKREKNLECFLKSGVSLIIPMKAFYVKTSLEDKYVGPDEQAISCNELDSDYTHTAVMHYTQLDNLIYFNIMRVTKDLQYTASVLSENLTEEEEEQEMVNDSDVSSSEGESESEDEGRELRYPSEFKHKTLVQTQTIQGVPKYKSEVQVESRKSILIQGVISSKTQVPGSVANKIQQRELTPFVREVLPVSNVGSQNTMPSTLPSVMGNQNTLPLSTMGNQNTLPLSRKSLLPSVSALALTQGNQNVMSSTIHPAAMGNQNVMSSTPVLPIMTNQGGMTATNVLPPIMTNQNGTLSRSSLVPSMRNNVLPPVMNNQTNMSNVLPPVMNNQTNMSNVLPPVMNNQTNMSNVLPPVMNNQVVLPSSRKNLLPSVGGNQTNMSNVLSSVIGSQVASSVVGNQVGMSNVLPPVVGNQTTSSVGGNQVVFPSSRKSLLPSVVGSQNNMPSKRSLLPVTEAVPEQDEEEVVPVRRNTLASMRRNAIPVAVSMQNQEDIIPTRRTILSSMRQNSAPIAVLIQDQEDQEDDSAFDLDQEEQDQVYQEDNQDQEEQDQVYQEDNQDQEDQDQVYQEDNQEDQVYQEDSQDQEDQEDSQEEDSIPIKTNKVISVKKSASLSQQEREQDLLNNGQSSKEVELVGTPEQEEVSSGELEDFDEGELDDTRDIRHSEV